MSYSNNGGGTLTLPSPTHVHHVDMTSAVRSLRRSLSRSPSKFRLVTHRSPSQSPKSPLSPSPLSPSSPSTRAQSAHLGFFAGTPSQTHTPSPLAKPFPPSVKLSLRSATRAKTTTPTTGPKTRASPRSPLKRALSQSSDTVNSQPTPTFTARGKENRKSDIIGAAERRSLEKQIQDKSMVFNYEITAPINQALARLEGNDGGTPIASTSSPLKRSDAIMNLDQASLGSPVAKRRSLHGSASFGHDFNVFDHGPTSSPHFDIHDDARPEFDLTTAFTAGNSSPNFAALPRRSSSLRKSTLQQRHGDKTSWGRRHAYELSSLSNEYSTPVASKNRPRLSLDQFMPPLQRDSPFTSQGSLPNASMHILNPGQPKQHPLSRTLTTSSSSSSIVDESPTHVPVHFGENPRPKLDFSKSLPAGALRPLAFDTIQREEFGSQTFSTPENYKSVKPLPAAFMSTGLISKVNHYPEDPPIIRGISKNNMPDTPCKKPINGFATMPAPVAGSAVAKARHIRHSFGTPSTPFNPHGNRQTSGGFGANGGVFGSSFKSSAGNRRGSFLSDNGDETGGSPDMKADSQYSTENELPPTPTKQALFHGMPNSVGNGSPQSLRTLPPSAHGLSNKNTRKSSKLSVLTTSYDQDEDESDEADEFNDSPTVAVFRLSRNSSSSMPSFSRSRALRGSNLEFPPPLAAKSLTSFLSPMRKPGFAKTSHVVPASPLDRIDFMERLSPCTPQEGMLPPDNSRLSFSTRRTRQFHRQNSSTGSAMPPPATPTTARESLNKDGGITPVNGTAPAEVDEDLSSKFEKVELIGAGEFSVVYRVTQPIAQTQSFFFGVNDSPLGRSPSSPLPQRVFAVKKARQPYQGIRDRNRKLQEVDVLKALGQSDHVVHLIDSWEQKDYLYIETEYCEEGPLDKFLSQVGRKGRLDDFRIWKIMLELGQGLKHIHDSGFIHLDLKPANIFITFEGVLKIGDFGMATAWPAQPGIEGEGDREYIGPEILLGQYDKPADVFALGLIMLEIAGNVQLPDNGPTWQRLRSGDMSDVPSLTWSSTSMASRDATGMPVDDSDASMDSFLSDDEIEGEFGSPSMHNKKRHYNSGKRSLSHDPGNLFGSVRRGELHAGPAFMRDPYHEHALDRLVKWMITPRPQDRPTVDDILNSEGLRWVQNRRRAGATVFEGSWGPADAVLADDAEMIDV